MESQVINQDESGQYFYCRANSIASFKLADILKNEHQPKIIDADSTSDAMITCSGMAAITTVLQGLTFYDSEKYNIIYGDEMYCGVKHVCNTIAMAPRISIFTINVENTDNILELFNELSGQNNILLIESCNNPRGQLFDYSIIPTIKVLSGSFSFIVDNTWLTHIVFNPFDYGADFVVLSLTKYYSGGQAIAGALITHNKSLEKMRNWATFIGSHVSPRVCDTIIKSIETLKSRIESSHSLTIQTLEYLSQQSKISTIYYPKSPFFVLGPSIITFDVPCRNKFKTKETIDKITTIDTITSYGAPKSRLDPFARKFRDKNKKNVARFRLALGFDDNIENVIKAISQLLSLF